MDLLLKEQGAGTRISTPAGNTGPLGARIWIAAGVTDMRRGFQGLAAQVQTALEQQPYSGHIFLFRGRRGGMVKLLWFDGEGLCLIPEAVRTWTFCMASGKQWYRISESRSVVDAARRDRLESASSNGGTGDEVFKVSSSIHAGCLLLRST